MEIYVQSCGVYPNHDYTWLRNDNKLIKPPVLHSVDRLRQKNAPAVILSRTGEELRLLVFALKSKQRCDFQGREIFNSLVWIAKTAEEPFLRMLAASALRKEDEFLEVIDRSIIDYDNELGFKVLWTQIQELSLTRKAGEQLPDQTKKIGKNSPVLTHKLAEELDKHKLPNQEGAIVVVTGIVDSLTLKQAGVWRSLSSLVEQETWEEFKKEKDLFIGKPLEILRLIYTYLMYCLERIC
ncbi:hypothetical protein ACE1B6_20525 [Aerosakkonemataceae cyanobacterium BLCC-F154]|uniref:Uncharacterized protein n=1 Tax=Floridaenema fluviatile BLCC-F154 TaxID=3153640 RepID=A0ABV4YFN9_9CYAN